jgi:hypothetical protein
MIGKRNGIHIEFFCPIHELVDFYQSIEQGIVGMIMEVDKSHASLIHFHDKGFGTQEQI